MNILLIAGSNLTPETRGQNLRATENKGQKLVGVGLVPAYVKQNPKARGLIRKLKKESRDGRQDRVIEDTWKLAIRYWILDIRLLPFLNIQ